jgi:Phosphotransferase enzyme family
MESVELKATVSGLLGRSVTRVEPVRGGRNSRVYKLVCEDSRRYAAKLYSRHGADDRDRLKVEFSALRFLWDNGVTCIPEPVAADERHGCAVYEYVQGKDMPSDTISEFDIDYAVQFLAAIDKLRKNTESEHLAAASEACFSIREITDNIRRRLGRLSALPNGRNGNGALREFLANEFAPSFDAIAAWSQSSVDRAGASLVSELPHEERTLSPSDFGFHNALRRDDGRIAFLDFEYFGWDDPAKLLADFLLHPAMDLSEELKRRFAAGMLRRFADRPRLAERVASLYPLFGLKWCLIFLNEFIPEDLLRREFASASARERSDLQAEQLAKARRMLERIRNEYECFPYRN